MTAPQPEVHKFGGTSVAGPERLRAVAALIRDAARRPAVVVVSAMGDTTDRLEDACIAAESGDRTLLGQELAALDGRHAEALEAFTDVHGSAEVRSALELLAKERREVLTAAVSMGELPERPRARVLATGEKACARLMALALTEIDLPSVAIDADTCLDTALEPGGGVLEAPPLHGAPHTSLADSLRPHLEAQRTPVVTGFCGRGPDGTTTLLGRGGSDLTATTVGAAIGAERVVVWTDVDGVRTADPRVVPEARTLAQLNYREAAELAYYGARVLHQHTLAPVSGRGIPVFIRSTFDIHAAGTRIDSSVTPGSHPVKAISAVHDLALVSLEGGGMAGVPGIAARMFSALAAETISVVMISQSSAESSICLAVQDAHAERAARAIHATFDRELAAGSVDQVRLERGIGLVAAVGLGMAQQPGVAQRVFGALGGRGLNVLAIAQGSSELNVTLAVNGDDVDHAVRAIHAAFGLDRSDTGSVTPEAVDVMLLGCGRIGRELTEQIADAAHLLWDRFQLRPRVVAACDRSGFILNPEGLTAEALQDMRASKEAGRNVASLPNARPGSPKDMVDAALAFRLTRPVLVDVSTGPEAAEAHIAALRQGCDVVTANKDPLAGPRATYDALFDAARRSGRRLRSEATVGGGLPVVDTLDMLLATGDRLERIEGCLSGTLAFCVGQLESGRPLSEVVAEAAQLGYTEPDPAIDLCGGDVVRKAVILGRLSGLVEEGIAPAATGLVDASWTDLPLEELLERLRNEVDAPLGARVTAAKAAGRALRFVARVERDSLEVGLEEVGSDSPFMDLEGTDNLVAFTTNRYSDRPLVVRGPGAGVELTAMAVLADVLRVAVERRSPA